MGGRRGVEPRPVEAEELAPLPRGFVVFVVAFAIYLLYRLYQGVEWVVNVLVS